ncbi:hypothetical protein FOMG_08663 [Fusarium oxysporum f. sp. melonis 26406]|uniref:Uncharacterized protein n=1 Tax=Fusarium oxysporum f. sp. melonis 26406 TaxID=1089452 RepID=X0AZ08_FUSOX|nr:hypothetical protein FOMG_08663 [Fusarium oxysporum f. sp. melonis 26406]
MPLPDTDEMIQARWGKRQWDFYNWANDNAKALQDTLKLDAEWNALDLLLQKRWPRKKDREDYYAWSRQWNGRFMLRMSYKWSPQEFIDKVLATNFFEAEGSVDLWWAMDTYNLSSIPIGHAKFGGVESYYAFRPAHNFLKPDRNESGPSVLGTSILAMTVKFTKPRTQSIASASSGTFDSSSSGSKASSIFSRPEKPAPRTRASTGSGESNNGAVYVLYHPNSSIEVQDHSDGEELAPEAKDHVPGRLHSRCNEGFLLAKIADNLKELGKFNKEFRFLPITKTASKIHCAQLFENNEHGLTIGPALAMVKRAA